MSEPREPSASGVPRGRKHLMTPGQVRPASSRTPMAVGVVQRWVLSVLAVTTILHLSAGLVLAAKSVDVRSSQIGLLVISGAFGLIAMASGLLIHRRSVVNPLMLVGLVPALLGAWWVL